MDAAGHVAGSVRSGDPDRHVSTLYAPADLRPALLALYAFNLEISRIRDLARESMPGEIRLQWWRDAVMDGGASGNPVADALTTAIDSHALPRQAFARMLDARIFDLYDDPMPDRASLEGYLGETASALVQLASIVLDAPAAARFASAAGHAGCAQGIAGLLAQLPLHRARGQCFVPAEILAAAGTDRDRFLAEPDSPASRGAVAAMAALGREHLTAFAQAARGLPQSLRPAYLPAAPVRALLAASASGRSPSPIRRQAAMLWRASVGW